MALALFAVVWLQMALAPCLMAHEALADGDLPCPHCPPADEAPCHEAAVTRCDYIGDYDHEGRLSLGDDDVRTSWVAVPELATSVAALTGFASDLAHDDRAPSPLQPPLRHRHCVYLI